MYMKTITLLFASMILFLAACNNTEERIEIVESIEVVQLLERSEKIQLGAEWDFVQNFYQNKKLNIDKNPKAFQDMLELAELFIKEARVTGEHGHYYPAALVLTDNIIANASDPDVLFQALVTKAGVKLSLHEFDQALATGKKALAINGTSAQVYGVLVDAFVELGNYKKAVAMADKMVSIKPDLRSYSRVSYLREIHGDEQGAEKALEFAINAGFPGYEETAWAMLTLGELFIKQERFKDAIQLFDQILAIRKDYPFAIAAKAQVKYLQDDLVAAEKLLAEAIDIIPEVGFYVQLAQIYKDTNRSAQLNNIMSDIFLMLEDDVASGHNMNLEYAHIYIDLVEDYAQAHRYAEIEWNKRPKNADVNKLMSQILVLQNKENEAEKYIAMASVN